MGAGHDGAARELCRRLESRGAKARTVDFLDASPLVGRLLHRVYGFQLRAAPWSYEAVYRIWYLLPALCRPIVALLSFVFGRRLRRWAAELGAHAVVSTYPLASVVLGHEKEAGRLTVPVVTFLTDFAVHPLWVHPSVDLHLCVHPQSARQAAEVYGATAEAPGPLVPDRFRANLPGRMAARKALGLPLDERVVLVVAGSWGVGDLEETFSALASSGRYLPVAVCGTNEALRKRLERRGGGIVLGWTDDMPSLMAAADALVQNAGGLTCMEAFAAGLPVVTFRPIPGHGRQNADDMLRAGVTAFASDDQELLSVLDLVSDRAGTRLSERAKGMFRGDAATDALALTTGAEPVPALAERRVARRAAAVALATFSLYSGLNLAADAAVAHGIGTARPAPESRAAYVAVRLGPGALDDPGVTALLARDRVTAVVEGDLALADPGGVRRLTLAGVDVANGGWGEPNRLHVLQPADGLVRASEAIDRAARRRCAVFAPEEAVNGIDLASARIEHERIVQVSRVVGLRSLPSRLGARLVYVIDAEHATPSAVEAALNRIRGGPTPVEPLRSLE